MDQEWWLEAWSKGWTPYHNPQPNARLVKYLHLLGLEPGKRVFLPLCGKSVDLHFLAKRGYEVLGNELSELAVKSFFEGLDHSVTEADPFRRYQSGPITILRGDFFALTARHLEGTIDAVYDRGSLIALEPALRRHYVPLMTKLTPAGCKTLLITADYSSSKDPLPPYNVSDKEVHDLYQAQHRIELLDEELGACPPHLLERGVKEVTNRCYLITRV